METLNAIEERINKLNRALGIPNTPIDDKTTTTSTTSTTTTSENLTDSIISANMLIESSLSGRDKITNVIKRTDELETYLDPNYTDYNDGINSRVVYINSVAPELANNFEQLEEISRLDKTLGAEYLQNLPNCVDQLRRLHQQSEEQKQQNDLLEMNILSFVQLCSEKTDEIYKQLREMNDRVKSMEDRLKAHKKVDVDL